MHDDDTNTAARPILVTDVHDTRAAFEIVIAFLTMLLCEGPNARAASTLRTLLALFDETTFATWRRVTTRLTAATIDVDRNRADVVERLKLDDVRTDTAPAAAPEMPRADLEARADRLCELWIRFGEPGAKGERAWWEGVALGYEQTFMHHDRARFTRERNAARDEAQRLTNENAALLQQLASLREAVTATAPDPQREAWIAKALQLAVQVDLAIDGTDPNVIVSRAADQEQHLERGMLAGYIDDGGRLLAPREPETLAKMGGAS